MSSTIYAWISSFTKKEVLSLLPLISLVVLSLLLLGCGGGEERGEDSAEDSTEETLEDEEVYTWDECYDYYFDFYQDNANSDFGKQFYEGEDIAQLTTDACYAYQEAVAKEDVLVCEKITEKHRSSWFDLYTICITNVAKETRNPQLCDKAVGAETLAGFNNKELCIYQTAVEALDQTMCGLIPSESINFITCIGEIAKKTDNLELCNQLTDEISNQVCREGVLKSKG